MPSILLLGCGQIGLALAERLIAQQWSVTAIRRRWSERGAMPQGLHTITADLADTASQIAVTNAQYVVYTPSPDNRELAAYEYLYSHVLATLLKSVRVNTDFRLWLQVSSTSVYGQNEGQVVDESSLVSPSSPTSQCIVAAERLLLSSLPDRSTCLRFSGIYGPGRNYLLRKVVRGEALRDWHYTNRIHQEDCVGLIAHVLAQHERGQSLVPLILGTDTEPVTEYDIGLWLSAAMGVSTPPSIHMEGPSGKRCHSRYLKQIGYQFLHPSFQSGYAAEIERLNLLEPNWLARLDQRW